MGYKLEDEELFFGDAQTTTCIEKFSVVSKGNRDYTGSRLALLSSWSR